MLKKIIISAALVTSFAALLATPAKADSILSDTIYPYVSTDHSLTALSASLDELTMTMNQTVNQVSSQKKDQLLPVTQSAQTPADKLVSTAKKYLGVPYIWGGTTPAGFDCSGFTSYVYKEALGKTIGRTTWDQISNGRKIPLNQAKIGDLIIFYGGGHVGLYLGDNQFIHASEPGENVQISSLSEMQGDYALQF